MPNHSDEALAIFRRTGGCIENTHAVFTSGKHSGTYINKDAIYPHTSEVSHLCRMLAEQFADDGIEVVVGPAVGGVALTQWVAHHLSQITKKEVIAVFAEKREYLIHEVNEDHFSFHVGNSKWELPKGFKIMRRAPGFVIQRGQEKLVDGKQCLGVEDILSTGTSARDAIDAARKCGGNIIGLGALWNRGRVSAEAVGNVELYSLINTELAMWEEEDCPLCMAGEPINTDVGHGREFLNRRWAEQPQDS